MANYSELHPINGTIEDNHAKTDANGCVIITKIIQIPTIKYVDVIVTPANLEPTSPNVLKVSTLSRQPTHSTAQHTVPYPTFPETPPVTQFPQISTASFPGNGTSIKYSNVSTSIFPKNTTTLNSNRTFPNAETALFTA